MEKLILAQDTSNVDDTGLSSHEIKERKKKRRCAKAKRQYSSFSEDEEVVTNKENSLTKNKKLPPLPQEEYVPTSPKINTPLTEIFTQRSENLICNEILANSVSNKVSLFITTNKCYCFFRVQAKIFLPFRAKNRLQRQMYVLKKKILLLKVICL